MAMKRVYDCIVLGGGPAGSTAGALVAEAGFSTLVVERGAVPRYHIGESLMPETYWTFERLGVLDRMKRSAYPKKYSVQFVSHSGRESQPFYFFETNEHESSQTWQVVRSDFDKMLLDNAVEKGAEVRDATRALDVLFEGDRAVGVRVQAKDAEPEEIGAKVVIDATGQQSIVATRLGLREAYPDMRNASIWGYYRGGRRDTGVDEGATIILHTKSKEAWFWYIPLPDDLVSVGVVSENDYLLKGRGRPEQVFEEELTNCPAVLERLMDAKLDSDFFVARDFSYRSREAAGNGWVLIGDAYGFIDPVYSSGVFLALKSGELAADAVVEGLRSGDLSGAQLGRWAESYGEGMKWILKLVRAFYTEHFSFGQFIRAYPHHKDRLTDLLVGKVFRPGVGEIFDDMDPWLAEAGRQAAEQMPASE